MQLSCFVLLEPNELAKLTKQAQEARQRVGIAFMPWPGIVGLDMDMMSQEDATTSPRRAVGL